MAIVVKLIGIFIALIGLILALTSKGIKQVFEFFAKGKRIYSIGILRILFGIIFLWTASQCKRPEVIRVLGVLFIIAGSFIFILGIRKIKSILTWWNQRPSWVLRLLNLLALAFGILIIYSA